MTNIPNLQKSLNRRHRKLKSWRLVAKEYGINVGYIYRLAKQGIEPENPSIRQILGLPLKCPHCQHRLEGQIKHVKSLWDYPVNLLKYMVINREEWKL